MRPPLPPYSLETAVQKARAAEDAWNSRDPSRVVQAYTEDSRWRNRAEFLVGRGEIEAFLSRKWRDELDYRLIKEVWAASGHRIAVRFVYECHDERGAWKRAHGNEQWEFDGDGLMRRREASIAAGTEVAEGNNELFVFRREHGAWKIHRYLFSTSRPRS